MSSVADLVKYSIAIDEGKFLKPETWEKVFTPYVTPKGTTIQYGLGWFVKEYKGIKIIWHSGWWYGYSIYSIFCYGVIVNLAKRESRNDVSFALTIV